MPESLKIRDDLPAASRMHAELEALRLQSAALTSAANAVMITDCDGTISWVNPAFTTLTGYTSAEAIGKNSRDLVKSGKQETSAYKDLWERILAGHVWHGELVNRRKDGISYNELQTITPIRGESGKITHFIAIMQDITEAKNAEDELRILYSKRHQAVEFNPAVLYTLKFEDGGVRPVFVSDNIERLLGVASKDATSGWWRKSLHPVDRKRVMAILANVKKSKGYSIEYRIRKESGAYIWVHDANHIMRDSAGLPTGLTGAWVDVSERKRTERTLHAVLVKQRALVARLQTVREEERTHVARKIHDILAQELTRLKIDLVWLQRRLKVTDPVPTVGDLTVRVAEMVQMADTAISSVQKVATELRPVVLDSLGLNAAIEWLAREFSVRAGVPCEIWLPEKEPAVNRDCAIAVFRIVQESLTNIARYAGATRVNVRLWKEPRNIALRIGDNGCGIRPNALKNPLSIGLAGMRERALSLNGTLDIRSKPDLGTTIELRIPLSKCAVRMERRPQ